MVKPSLVKTISVFSSWSVCEKKSLESEGKWGRPFSLPPPPFLAQLHSLSQEFALMPPNSWLENRKKVVKSLSILVPGVRVGGTPLYMPYRYVPPYGVGIFGLKTGIHLAHFGVESGTVFEGTTSAHERVYPFNSK